MNNIANGNQLNPNLCVEKNYDTKKKPWYTNTPWYTKLVHCIFIVPLLYLCIHKLIGRMIIRGPSAMDLDTLQKEKEAFLRFIQDENDTEYTNLTKLLNVTQMPEEGNQPVENPKELLEEIDHELTKFVKHPEFDLSRVSNAVSKWNNHWRSLMDTSTSEGFIHPKFLSITGLITSLTEQKQTQIKEERKKLRQKLKDNFAFETKEILVNGNVVNYMHITNKKANNSSCYLHSLPNSDCYEGLISHFYTYKDNKQKPDDLLSFLQKIDVQHIFLYNPPGVGRSSGSKTRKNLVNSCKGMISHIEKTIVPSKLFLSGRSLGAGVNRTALEELDQRSYPCLVVSDRSFSTLTDLIGDIFCSCIGALAKAMGWSLGYRQPISHENVTEVVIQSNNVHEILDDALTIMRKDSDEYQSLESSLKYLNGEKDYKNKNYVQPLIDDLNKEKKPSEKDIASWVQNQQNGKYKFTISQISNRILEQKGLIGNMSECTDFKDVAKNDGIINNTKSLMSRFLPPNKGKDGAKKKQPLPPVIGKHKLYTVTGGHNGLTNYEQMFNAINQPWKDLKLDNQTEENNQQQEPSVENLQEKEEEKEEEKELLINPNYEQQTVPTNTDKEIKEINLD